MYEHYFCRRLREELLRAEEALSSAERETHLQACRYYRALLHAAVAPYPADEPLIEGGAS